MSLTSLAAALDNVDDHQDHHYVHPSIPRQEAAQEEIPVPNEEENKGDQLSPSLSQEQQPPSSVEEPPSVSNNDEPVVITEVSPKPPLQRQRSRRRKHPRNISTLGPLPQPITHFPPPPLLTAATSEEMSESAHGGGGGGSFGRIKEHHHHLYHQRRGFLASMRGGGHHHGAAAAAAVDDPDDMGYMTRESSGRFARSDHHNHGHTSHNSDRGSHHNHHNHHHDSHQSHHRPGMRLRATMSRRRMSAPLFTPTVTAAERRASLARLNTLTNPAHFMPGHAAMHGGGAYPPPPNPHAYQQSPGIAPVYQQDPTNAAPWNDQPYGTAPMMYPTAAVPGAAILASASPATATRQTETTATSSTSIHKNDDDDNEAEEEEDIKSGASEGSSEDDEEAGKGQGAVAGMAAGVGGLAAAAAARSAAVWNGGGGGGFWTDVTKLFKSEIEGSLPQYLNSVSNVVTDVEDAIAHLRCYIICSFLVLVILAGTANLVAAIGAIFITREVSVDSSTGIMTIRGQDTLVHTGTVGTFSVYRLQQDRTVVANNRPFVCLTEDQVAHLWTSTLTGSPTIAVLEWPSTASATSSFYTLQLQSNGAYSNGTHVCLATSQTSRSPVEKDNNSSLPLLEDNHICIGLQVTRCNPTLNTEPRSSVPKQQRRRNLDESTSVADRLRELTTQQEPRNLQSFTTPGSIIAQALQGGLVAVGPHIDTAFATLTRTFPNQNND